MIKLITNNQKFSDYVSKFSYSQIWEGKMLSLFKSYGLGGNICRFYVQINDSAEETAIISQIGWDFSVAVIDEERIKASELARKKAEPEPAPEFDEEPKPKKRGRKPKPRPVIVNDLDVDFSPDYSEIALFLYTVGAKTVFLSSNMLTNIEPFIDGEMRYNILTEYSGSSDLKTKSDNKLKVLNQKNPETFPLDTVYDIIKNSFNIERGYWLTDISHRVRHGISTVWLYDGAATVTALYDESIDGDDKYKGTVYLTQVCTTPDKRDKGLATAMLEVICENYRNEGKRIMLVCRPELYSFYEKIGFKEIGKAANIYSLKPIASELEK